MLLYIKKNWSQLSIATLLKISLGHNGILCNCQTMANDDQTVEMGQTNEDIAEKIRVSTARVKENPLIGKAMQTFLQRYDTITKAGTFANARLTSALHRYGWVFGGNISSSQGGHFRRGRRIAINAKSAGRRRGKVSRGKEKILQGRPKGMKTAALASIHELPVRNNPKGKRFFTQEHYQNAGKW